MKKKVTVESFFEYCKRSSMDSYQGSKGLCSLDIVTEITPFGYEVWFEVTENGKVVHKAQRLESAVKAFNQL